MMTQQTGILTTQGLKVRKRDERGRTLLDWLDSYHTFSFGDYYAPKHMGFSVLRVINDDLVAPEKGFDTHSHHDMEIITYVLDGILAHKDSLGNGSLIRPGEVQRMTAGSGIRHSEFNPSDTDPVHLLQIWILPEQKNLTPGYEQKGFTVAERRDQWRLILSRDAREGSLSVHQDLSLYTSLLSGGQTLQYSLAPNRAGWLQVATGSVEVNGILLANGDGLAIQESVQLTVEGQGRSSEILLFDVPESIA